MTLTQLSYIVAVNKYRHFATAAEKIYVTQPTLSMQIHKLEEQLGVKIFDRSRSPVVPTEVGEKIIQVATEILKQARHIEDIARMSDETLRGTFRIGVIPTIAPYLLPLFLKSFMESYPEVELVIEELLTQDVIEGLTDDTLDAGIIATPTEQSHIYVEELYKEPFVGYLSGDHPLNKNKSLKVNQIEDMQVWLMNEGHCLRNQALKLCKKARSGNGLSIRFESGNLETLKKLVEQNFGMTLMPILAVQDFDSNCANAVVKQFEAPVPSRKVRLIYGREFLKKKLIKALKKQIQDHLPPELKKNEKLLVID